jgi:hypothetical protein
MDEILTLETKKDQDEIAISIRATFEKRKEALRFWIAASFGDHEGSLEFGWSFRTRTVSFDPSPRAVLPTEMHPSVACLVSCGVSSLTEALAVYYRSRQDEEAQKQLLHRLGTRGSQTLGKIVDIVWQRFKEEPRE